MSLSSAPRAPPEPSIITFDAPETSLKRSMSSTELPARFRNTPILRAPHSVHAFSAALVTLLSRSFNASCRLSHTFHICFFNAPYRQSTTSNTCFSNRSWNAPLAHLQHFLPSGPPHSLHAFPAAHPTLLARFHNTSCHQDSTFRICFSAVLPTLLARSHDAPYCQGRSPPTLL